MLLGFPLDYCAQEHIQNAIEGSFGGVIIWEVERSNLLLVKDRVTSLEEVPQFIVFPCSRGLSGDFLDYLM